MGRASVVSKCLVLSFAGALPVLAQQIPLQLVVSQPGSTVRVQNGATLPFSSALGRSQSVQLRTTYTGTGRLVFPESPAIFGAAAFSAVSSQGLPLTLDPGGTASFEIRYQPASAAEANAILTIPYRETLVAAGGEPATTTGSLSFSLQGTAPSLVLSYILQSDQNVIPLQAGGAILYPATRVGTTAQAALTITNLGSGAGEVTGISLVGANFRIAGLPLLPVSLAPRQSLQVQIFYTPTEVRADAGQVTISFGDGSTATVNLEGSGSAARLVYQILKTDPPAVVEPGGTIRFEDVAVGQTARIAIQLLNTGNASGAVSTITATGQGFQVAGAPPLPQTLAPNASLTFAVTYTPAAPGPAEGRLVVNGDVLNLKGLALGPQLSFMYITGGSGITLGPDQTSVVFSPVLISESGKVDFRIKNTGTLPATIANIGVGQAGGPFAVGGLPALPVRLEPDTELPLSLTFTPTALGFANGTLLIDTQSFGLVGSGTQPPPLPAYTISGLGGTVAAASQANVRLTLANSYPVTISGTVTLAVSGNRPADPAVQFATGGRVVPFVIPANGTEAVFSTPGTQVGLQTGTVASTLTLTPLFQTQAGGINLTPQAPAVLRSEVAAAPPSLIASQITAATATGFTLSIMGYTTTRTLTSWRIELALDASVKNTGSSFVIDVQQIAAGWFRSANSQDFGGQFVLSIPILMQGTLPEGETLLSKITSVDVWVSNELGASNSLQTKTR